MVKQHAHGHVIQCSLPPTFFEIVLVKFVRLLSQLHLMCGHMGEKLVAIVFDITHHLTPIKFFCQSISHTKKLI